jgi:hypothetical protein
MYSAPMLVQELQPGCSMSAVRQTERQSHTNTVCKAAMTAVFTHTACARLAPGRQKSAASAN